MVREILILGGGSAGLMVALALRRHVPGIRVRVVRSSSLGVIGVGEGSTADLPAFFHGFLGIPPAEFFRAVQPSLKLGIRFDWGRGDPYFYTFAEALRQVVGSRQTPCGFASRGDLGGGHPAVALMEHGKVFLRHPDGPWPDVRSWFGYHVENRELVAWLEATATAWGAELMDGDLAEARVEDGRIAGLRLADGRELRADLYVDASGFAAELLGKALGEPFVGFDDSLVCDRAVVGGWDRTDEVLQGYTASEVMSAGWCWQIEHPGRINRGYVYSSRFITDAAAEAEFRAANPRVGPTRIVPFRTGRRARQWVGNVLAVGNAAGFVEPLEATALMCISHAARFLALALKDADGAPSPTLVGATNRLLARQWDEIRDFLAMHYRFQSRLDTPFWRHCRGQVALHGAERIVDYYRENGPTFLAEIDLIPPAKAFNLLEGYWVHLLGMGVPHARADRANPEEVAAWQAYMAANRRDAAERGWSMAETLAVLHDPRWSWTPGFFGPG
jgi:tryptophan 7-halogenase